MSVLAWFAYLPALLIGLMLAAAVIWWGFLGARGLARLVRYQVRLRFRKVRVPADGEPLDELEERRWECFTDAWEHDRAPEPAYEWRRQQWDS